MDNYIVDLGTDDLLRVSGPDSATFLQGQLTCDLTQLDTQRSSLGAVCNTKGRVVSAFRIFVRGGDYFLSMPGGMLAHTTAHLDRYRVFYKAELNNASGDFHHLGLSGPDTANTLSRFFPDLPSAVHSVSQHDEHGIVIQVADKGQEPRYECWLSDVCSNTLHHEFAEEDACQWQRLNIRQKLWLPTADQSAEYTPEELNLDLLGAVSFDKGCYTGQEIVARMHYRGQAKKRLVYFRTRSASDITAQHKVWHLADGGNDNKAGIPVLTVVADNEGHLEGLLVLKTDKLPSSPQLSASGMSGLSVHLQVP